MQALTRSSVKKNPSVEKAERNKTQPRDIREPNLTRGITVAADQIISIKNSWRERSSLHNMEGDSREKQGTRGKPYRHSGTFAKGLRRIPLRRSLAFSSGPARPEAAATDRETPDGVARRSLYLPSADPSTASPRTTTSAASPLPWSAGTWEAVAYEDEQEAATAAGRLDLPPSPLLCPLFLEEGAGGRGREGREGDGESPSHNEKLTRRARQIARAMATSLVVHHWHVGTASSDQGCQRESAALSAVRRYA